MEAENLGMVTRVIDDNALASEGEVVTQMPIHSATAALGAVRALLIESSGATLRAQLAKETTTISAAGGYAESAEGIAAYFTKRKPNVFPANH